jgi:N-acetylneuraminate synthase|tara:strand:+ start:3394 stop:4257 length:864 start_codon:yes stop_codon:yes gene_type:complete
MKEVIINGKAVGTDCPVFIVAEVGINHNGSVDIAKEMIRNANNKGVDTVKLQKRTIEVVYSKEELDKYRESPWGTTNRAQKEGLEFGKDDYDEIDRYCKSLGLMWFVSCWDKVSVDFIDQYDPPCYKISSASLTDHDLLKYHRTKGKPVILATGMSTMDEIDAAVNVLGKENLILLHSTSTYPCKPEELNLKVIKTLIDKFDVPIGYSGHEVGVSTTVAAVALGACMVERHFTLDRSMYGSDQAASLEPEGLRYVVDYIRTFEKAIGDGVKRVYDSEVLIKDKLRKE